MKRTILLFSSLLALVVQMWAQGSFQQSPQGWKLIWSDEFEADGPYNKEVWEPERGFVRNHEAQWYQGDNARQEGGCLVIEARKEHRENPFYGRGHNDWRTQREYIEYTSASLTTRRSFDFTYGRMEVRAKIPTAGGSWPAIWLLGKELPWPSCGEIDVMEFYRIQGVPHILANACWGSETPHQPVWNSKRIPFSHFTEKDSDWASKFHVWRMDWTPRSISIYLDDELLNRIPLRETVNGALGQNINPFTRPQYILLNLAIGGDNGGEIDDAAMPMRYEIDYVRVYQRERPQQEQMRPTPLHSIDSGKLWPDSNGEHINAHGGGVMKYGDTYYWYGEHKSPHTSDALVGVTCYSSKDLINWTNEGVALSVSDEKGSDIERGCILERPKVVYNEKTKKFVMWFHLELKGRGYDAARSGVAVSETPTGPFRFLRSGRVNPGILPIGLDEKAMKALRPERRYKSWTDEWMEAVRKGLYVRRDLEGGQMARDMTVYVDDDGKAYHIYSSEENLTLQIAELTDDYTAHTGRYVRVAPAGHNEAPAIFKRNGTYWMITSGCTGWAPNEARMFSAPSIFGPWTQHPNPCVGPNKDLTFGGQSTFILRMDEGEKKDERFIFMADIWRPRHPIDARYIWLPITFTEEGVPVVEWRDSWSPE